MDQIIDGIRRLSLSENKKFTNLTGLVYHKDTLLHQTDEKIVHEGVDSEVPEMHGECPQRIEEVLKRLDDPNNDLELEKLTEFEEVGDDIIRQTHGEEYLQFYKKEMEIAKKQEKCLWVDEDTYYNKYSDRAARLAAQGTIECAEKVWKEHWSNGFALVRPPGHHAGGRGNELEGFCFLNNVAIATEHLKNLGAQKIAILDWDVHHGDSTQKIFYEDDQVLYVSIHKYLGGKFYPFGEGGSAKMLGENKGKGFNLNFPLDPSSFDVNVGDQEYVYLFERLIFPILREFKPEFVFISSGFDCMNNDPLGQLFVTNLSLGHMVISIIEKIQSKTVLVLEGGYKQENIVNAVDYLFRILLGDYYSKHLKPLQLEQSKIIKGVKPLPWFQHQCQEVLRQWVQYWPCLNSQKCLKYEETIKISVESSLSQAHEVFKNYKLIRNRLVKQIEKNEIIFFEKIYPYYDFFHDYFPRFYGLMKTAKGHFLKIENFVHDPQDTNLLVIYVQSRYQQKIFGLKMFQEKKFRLKTFKRMNKGEIVEYKDNSYLKFTNTDNQYQEMLQRLFTNYKGKIVKKSVKYIIKKLETFLQFLEQNKFSISYANLVIGFNRHNNQSYIYFYDFDHFDFSYDQNGKFAMKTLIDDLSELVQVILQFNKWIYLVLLFSYLSTSMPSFVLLSSFTFYSLLLEFTQLSMFTFHQRIKQV